MPTAGLLGLDVLTHFDHILNVPAGTLTVSTDPLPHAGQPIPLDEFMGVPIVTAQILGSSCRMMFDTGAKISYFQHDLLASFPPLGNVKDFYPGFGEFETPTYQVAMSLGGIPLTLRCGRLPGLLGDTLMMTTVQGILGNEIFSRRTIGYFPRWRKITI